MTKERFMEMAEAVIGSGKYDDGTEFTFYVSGKSVIIMTKNDYNERFPYCCEGWELGEDGELYCYGTWFEKGEEA